MQSLQVTYMYSSLEFPRKLSVGHWFCCLLQYMCTGRDDSSSHLLFEALFQHYQTSLVLSTGRHMASIVLNKLYLWNYLLTGCMWSVQEKVWVNLGRLEFKT